jgi:hypothetical protein
MRWNAVVCSKNSGLHQMPSKRAQFVAPDRRLQISFLIFL